MPASIKSRAREAVLIRSFENSTRGRARGDGGQSEFRRALKEWTPSELVVAKRLLRRFEEQRSRENEAYERACDAASEAWLRTLGSCGRRRRPGLVYPDRPAHVPVPVELQRLPCGAQTRTGAMCKMTSIYANGRCKFHGGFSTGPRTSAGREKAIANLAQNMTLKRADARVSTLEARVLEQLEKHGIAHPNPMKRLSKVAKTRLRRPIVGEPE